MKRTTARAKKPASRKRSSKNPCSLRFTPAKIDSLFDVLDGLAWLGCASVQRTAQFAGIDARTTGKLLRNSLIVGLVDKIDDGTYALSLPYPYKGVIEQKRAVVREALVRMPFLESVRQFLRLGDGLDDALRKAATVIGVENYEKAAVSPLVIWAQNLDVLKPDMSVELLLDDASEAKVQRHQREANKRVVFLSHSSKDKPVIQKLATDLTAAGVEIWLDEQRIRVGDSIPEKIAQGLAASDFFLLALSTNSVESEWVKRELNQALIAEIEKRSVVVLPVKLDSCEVPFLIKDKKYADLSKSYRGGLAQLIAAIKQNE